MTYGETIRDARTRAGLTLDALAAAVGISPQYLSKIELGKKGVFKDRERRDAIAEALKGFTTPTKLKRAAIADIHARLDL